MSGKHYNDIDKVFYGRGYVQVTWRDNYVKLTKAAKAAGYDWDFEHSPELLLLTGPSAWATVYGMKTGLYTNKSLSTYINYETVDFINARRIINALDKAELIKSYAVEFLKCIVH